ncbi:MAG: hypothetical protein HS108_00525 [Planctomycetes bacterium]|jgi:hypothetical protein|nr:hypothetical protein [Planctomycetota bacterium]MCL4789951.1 hypothetical protein [Verrucomicrobiota bacterium]
MACWAAKGGFLQSLGRTANVKVRGTRAELLMFYDGNPGKYPEEKVSTSKWTAEPSGIESYSPPPGFPRDLDRDDYSDGPRWGTTGAEKKEGKLWTAGTTLWD